VITQTDLLSMENMFSKNDFIVSGKMFIEETGPFLLSLLGD